MQRICDFIAKWMGVMVLMVATVSIIVPQSLTWVGTWVINPMLGIIMFGMGLTLTGNDFRIILRRPVDILIGCLTQFTVMPLLAWGLTGAFSSIAIALTVGIVVSHNADRLLTAGLIVVIVVILHNLLGLGVGYLVGRLLRLQRPKCVALSIEVGMQNSGLATSLAVLHFAAFPLATIPGAVFSVWHNISGAIVARISSATLSKKVETK